VSVSIRSRMAEPKLLDFDEREFEKNNKKLYLGNLPGYYQGTPKQQKEAARAYVENLCQRYGQPTDILVNVEKRFAFVTFPNKEAAQYAIYHLADSNVGGNVLHVSWSKPSKEQLAARDARRAREAREYAKKEPGDGTTTTPEGQKSAKPADGEAKTHVEKANPQAKTAEHVPVVVEEKPEPIRFSTQQKVAAPKPQPVKQVQPPNKSTPPPNKQTQPQNTQAQNKPQQGQPKQTQPPKAAAPQPKPPKQVPQRFKVTVQNETTPGLPTVVLSITFEEWSKYICPLISNNTSSTVI